MVPDTQPQSSSATDFGADIAEIRRSIAELTRALAGTIPARQAPEPESEFPPETRHVKLVYPEIRSNYITSILNGRFNPRNLLYLVPAFGITPAQDEDDTFALTTAGHVTTKKAIGSLKDFGYSPTRWSAAMGVYSNILALHYSANNAGLHRSIITFTVEITKLATVYDWQTQVLPLAISHHSTVIDMGVLTEEHWSIPNPTRDAFLRIDHGADKRKAGPPRSPLLAKRPRPSGFSATTNTCYKYNSGKPCSDDPCRYRHECDACGKSHPSVTCMVRRNP